MLRGNASRASPPTAQSQRRRAILKPMKLRRLSRIYLPPTFAMAVLTGAPAALADGGQDAGALADAGVDAGDAGEDENATGCGQGTGPAGTASVGAGCC